MKILVIGGNGFIGSPVVRELHSGGHTVAVFHRTANFAAQIDGVTDIRGDRNRLPDYRDDLQRFSPEIIVDLILSSGEQAQQLMKTAAGIAQRVIAISSMDVYRAWGVLQGVELGPLEPLPLTESSPVRSVRQLYPAESLQAMQRRLGWLTADYDKIAVEDQIMNYPSVPGTVLRLPMVYGPGDPFHRFSPVIKRIDDHRPFILLSDDFAAWRGPRGYVDNVAHAIALAVTSKSAAGRVYNVCQEPSLSEFDWQNEIAKQALWRGQFVILPGKQTPAHLRSFFNTAQHLVASSKRIRTELGYREPVETKSAIRQTIEWERNNPFPNPDPQQFDYAAEDAALGNNQ